MPASGWPGYLVTGQAFPPNESTIFETSSGVDSPDGSNQISLGIKDSDSARRVAMRQRVDLFRDNHRALVEAELLKMYEIENFSEVWKTIDLSNNVCKKIITQISTIYDQPPNWTLKDDGGAWKTIRDQGKLDLVMPVVNRYTNLCNTTLVHFSVIGGRPKFNAITADLFRVWADPIDSTRMVAYAYAQGKPDGTGQVWHYWSILDSTGGGAAKNMVFESAPNEKIKILFNEANPYLDESGQPTLPGVLYHNNLPTTRLLDATTGEDIVHGAVMICCMESALNWLYRCDAASLKYVAGELATDGTAGQIGGPQRFLRFRSSDGSAINVGQFRSQADWKGLRDVIDAKITNNASNYGLSRASVEQSGTPQSGFAIKVSKEGLIEIRKRQLPIYRSSDMELYAAACAVWNHERANVSGKKEDLGVAPAIGKRMLWPSEAGLSIRYAHYNVPMSPTELESELLCDQVAISMGKTTAVEIYQDDHPELTIEECEAKIRENVKLSKSIAGDFMLVIGRAQILNLAGEVVPPPAATGATSAPKSPNAPPSSAKPA